MGTNYYLRENICEHCGRSDEPTHIGKSSAGWCFALHVYPDQGIHDLPDWESRWATAPHAVIKDEYGRELSADEMRLIIMARVGITQPPTSSWLHENHAVAGPAGLVRHLIGGYSNCIGHGAGTWDLIAGEFS
jgi:hypothetical protein